MSDSIATELKRAVELVEDASIPEEFRPIAFASAFWASRESAATADGEPAAPSTAQSRNSSSEDLASLASLDGGDLAKIAAKLNVPLEDVEFVYELDGTNFGLCVPPSRFAPVLKEAVEQIVYLVAAGRQACGIDTKTSAREIKSVCAERGKADTNFSRILGGLHGEGVVVGGSGKAKTVAVNGDGFERAGKIVKRLKSSND